VRGLAANDTGPTAAAPAGNAVEAKLIWPSVTLSSCESLSAAGSAARAADDNPTTGAFVKKVASFQPQEFYIPTFVTSAV
jgi:hypothetical protein